MKIYIGPYKNWFGPYQLAEKILFWKDKNSDEVMNLGSWLAHGHAYEDLRIDPSDNIMDVLLERKEKQTWLYKIMLWFDRKKTRTSYIKIDRYDTWSMDLTLAMIILPMLKQLKDTKHGSPIVDLEDVPEHLRCDTYNDYDEQLCFDFYHEYEVKEGDRDIHARWDWVLDEMIWAFEQLDDEDSKVFYKKDGKWDSKSYEEHCNRMQKALTLFGKYFRSLWD